MECCILYPYIFFVPFFMLSNINFLCQARIYTYFVGVTLSYRLLNINFRWKAFKYKLSLRSQDGRNSEASNALTETTDNTLLPIFPFARSTENKRKQGIFNYIRNTITGLSLRQHGPPSVKSSFPQIKQKYELFQNLYI